MLTILNSQTFGRRVSKGAGVYRNRRLVGATTQQGLAVFFGMPKFIPMSADVPAGVPPSVVEERCP